MDFINRDQRLTPPNYFDWESLLSKNMPLNMKKCRNNINIEVPVKRFMDMKADIVKGLGLWVPAELIKSSPAHEGIETSNMCRYKSSPKKHLKDHNNRTHLEITFQCYQCYKAFTEKSCFRAHIQFVHFSYSATNAHSRGTLKDI